MARERRPLFDGTTWLVLLWGASMAIGIAVGFLAIDGLPNDLSDELRSEAFRNFLSAAAPFWIVGGVSLALSFAVDEITAQFRRLRHEY